MILASAEGVRRALLVLPRARRQAVARQWAKYGITPQDLERIVKRRPRWDPERLGPYIIAGDETLDKIAKIKLFGGPVPGPAASQAALRHWARPS